MVAITTDMQTRRPAARGCHLTLVPGVARTSPATYRLRRMVAAVVVAALAFAVWAVLGALSGGLTSSADAPTASAADSIAVVVAPGDTFWSIATRVQPSGDVRPLVDRLVRAHGGAALQAGERISVPRS